MRDHDDGLARFIQLGQQGHDLVTGARVEVAGRLIGQNNVRVIDQGSGDRHALLLAAGKLHGPMIEPIA